MSTKRALGREAAILLAHNFGGMMIGLIGTVLVTRALGPEARGVYAWVLTLHSLAAAIALLTPYNIVRKLAAEDASEHNWPEWLGSISVMNGLATLLTLPLLAWALWQPLGQQHVLLVLLSWASLPLTVVGASLAAFIQVRNRTSQVLGSMLITRLATTFLIVLAWSLNELSLTVAILLNTVLSSLTLLIFLAYLDIPLRVWTLNRQRLVQLRHFLGASWLSGMAAYAMPKLPLLLLPGHASLAAIGHFSLAITLFDIALMFPAAITSVLVTHFTRSGSAHGQKEALRILSLLILTMIAGGYVLSPHLIPLMFGAGFTEAVGLFRLMLFGLLFQIPLSIWSSATMAGHGPRTHLGLWLPQAVGTLAGLAVGWLAIPGHGAYGALAAMLAAYASQTLTLGLLRYSR